MIDQDSFVKRNELFDPKDVFRFVANLFKKQAEMMDAPLIFETVQKLYSPDMILPTDEQLDDELAPLPQQLIGDHLRLKQVLVNLIKNALKFSYGKPVRIKSCFNGREKKLYVQVLDSGRGIKPEDMKKLFQVFGKLKEQPDEPTVNAEGIGLGLTICKKIVENSGGKIDVYSAGEGQGSVFMFSMNMTLPEKSRKNDSTKKITKQTKDRSEESQLSATTQAISPTVKGIQAYGAGISFSQQSGPIIDQGLTIGTESVNTSRYPTVSESKPLTQVGIGKFEIVEMDSSFYSLKEESKSSSSKRRVASARSRLSTIKFDAEEIDDDDDQMSDYEMDLSIDNEAIELVQDLEKKD